MTVPDLISETLLRVRRAFYAGRVREFKRDERALTRAIARYGYACAQRGWSFGVREIEAELAALLLRIREQRADIRYLPVYLEGAVDRHIRLRAEELSARAKRTAPHVNRVLAGVQTVTAVIEPSPVEVLALLYRDLRARRRKPAPRVPAQTSLL